MQPSAADRDRFLVLIACTPSLMPARYLRERIWRAYSWRLDPNASPISANFRRKHLGNASDWFHAEVGAAYCNVFTCDQSTARDLHGIREALGHQPALAGATPVVADGIERQLDMALARLAETHRRDSSINTPL
ncbi:MAG: hypothetical protein JWN48_5618 [Myxococcaceae bacterium]|nr:hypothetical protein [Myxococcaceae bacterium]